LLIGKRLGCGQMVVSLDSKVTLSRVYPHASRTGSAIINQNFKTGPSIFSGQMLTKVCQPSESLR